MGCALITGSTNAFDVRHHVTRLAPPVIGPGRPWFACFGFLPVAFFGSCCMPPSAWHWMTLHLFDGGLFLAAAY